MKKAIILALACSLMLAGCSQTGEDTGRTPEEMSEQELCDAAGGVWKEMPNACVDSCRSQREGLMCAQVLTYGCDCGEGMCWNGESCEEI